MTAKRYLWILFVFFALAGCDDLEDTYSDYAGDGQIRYLTKCSDVKIVPGWEKLNMTWKNSTDPVVDSIRITWTLDKNTKKVGEKSCIMLELILVRRLRRLLQGFWMRGLM